MSPIPLASVAFIETLPAVPAIPDLKATATGVDAPAERIAEIGVAERHVSFGPETQARANVSATVPVFCTTNVTFCV